MNQLKWNRRDLIKTFGFTGLIAWQILESRLGLAAGTPPPRRMLFFYMPGGFHPVAWRPYETITNTAKRDGTYTKSLANLKFGDWFGHCNENGTIKDSRLTPWDVFDLPEYAALKSELLILDGVDMRCNHEGDGGDPHHHGIKSCLRGYNIQDETLGNKGPFPNTSVDVLIASKLYPNGIPQNIKSVESIIRFEKIGYQGEIEDAVEGNFGSVLKTESEMDLWKQLFETFQVPSENGAPAGPSAGLLKAQKRRSLLTGLHKVDLDRLKKSLGKDEQIILDKHIGAVDEIQRRIDADVAASNVPAPVGQNLKVPPKPGSNFVGKTDLLKKYKAVNDIIALAFAFNRTRVVNYFAFGHNNSESYFYENAGGSYHDGGVSHAGKNDNNGLLNPKAWRVGQVFLTAIADLMNKLKAIDEGGKSLLDSTTIASYVDMSAGDHEFTIPAPYFIAGGGGLDANGKRHWKTGQYVKLNNRSSNDYLVSLAHCMGAESGTDPILKSMQTIGKPGANATKNGLDDDGILA